MSGISSLHTSTPSSIATVESALAAGINFFDTAYSYGYRGESDAILREALGDRIRDVVIASKVGTHYDSQQHRIVDASPAVIVRHAEEILQRLGLDRIDLLYLHTPDESVPIERSAEAFAQLVDRELVRYVGISNVNNHQARRFASVIEPIAVQPPFNMLQRETLRELEPFIRSIHCGVASYWPLMKGLLAGAIRRGDELEANDKRRTYSIFQGESREQAHRLIDKLASIADASSWTVPQLVIYWTMHQPLITSVLCGAKRPEQIAETAAAMTLPYDAPTIAAIDGILSEHSQFIDPTP